jgi:hypothetical protein
MAGEQAHLDERQHRLQPRHQRLQPAIVFGGGGASLSGGTARSLPRIGGCHLCQVSNALHRCIRQGQQVLQLLLVLPRGGRGVRQGRGRGGGSGVQVQRRVLQAGKCGGQVQLPKQCLRPHLAPAGGRGRQAGDG